LAFEATYLAARTLRFEPMVAAKPRIRVLLVEDSPTDARLVQSMAERAQNVTLEITWVSTLKQALERLQLANIDLILLDLMLPDSPAQGTIRRIRQEVPGVPVVVWTSVDDPDFASKAIQAGAQDYLPKGRLDPDLLARTLRYAVDRQRIRSERERAFQELDEFAHIISHDLKAPLRGIASLARIIKEDLGDNVPADISENLDKLGDRAMRMGQMIDGVLAYSRRARVREAPSEFSVKALVDDIVEAIRPPEGFRVDTAGLPTLQSDRLRMQEVLQNLISNAVKYHDRPHEGTVRIVGSEAGDHYEFTVEDDGPGIPDHEKGRLFDLFHAPSAKTRADSTHVGLAIVKKIVESHGGTITVEPVTPRGARFRFTWPKDGSGIRRAATAVKN
jgi:signal transduction histidine kinase